MTDGVGGLFLELAEPERMDVIGDLVARDRRSDALAVRTDTRAGSYSYEKFCTNTWKAGNLLRHYGVRQDATVAIDAGDGSAVPPLLGFVGATLLGATVQFDPPNDTDARALVAPADRVSVFDPEPGTTVLAYGGDVDDPTVAAFERETWSENPTMPPDTVDPDASTLTTAEGSFSHRELLAGAADVVAEYDLDSEDEVALRASLSDPAAVAAGVLAPLLAGGTILLDRDATGTATVGHGPEARRVDAVDVL